MTLSPFKTTAALALLCAATALHAQMPTDNDAWKGRCAALTALDNSGNVPAAAFSLTHGVAGSKFTTFAFDRDNAGQHNVACTMFHLAAIAERAQKNDDAAHDAAVLATIQLKATKGESTTFSESFVRTKAKAREITKPALTIADEEAVLAAATTIPYGAALNAKPVTLSANQPAHLKR